MDEKVIFLDESGNTESGIADPDQFFITYASVYSTEKVCKEAIEIAFPKSQAPEIKYTQVKNRKPQVIEALSYVKNHGGLYKIYLVYKPLFLFHSLLTSLFENTAEHLGAENLSGNLDFAYYRMHDFWFYYLCTRGSDFLVSLIISFQRFVKHRDLDSYFKLFNLCKPVNDNGCLVTLFIFNSLQRLGYEGAVKLLESTGDNASWINTALPITIQLLSHWGFELKHPVTVIHDKSLPLETRVKIIYHLNNPTYESKKIYSNHDANTFWIPVPQIKIKNEIQFEDSQNFYGLQIADILAGAFNECGISMSNKDKKKEVTFYEQLFKLTNDQDFMHMFPDNQLTSPWFQEFIRLREIDHFCLNAFKKQLGNI